MKTLLIDNYDSYTYNLFQQVARVSGEEPRVVRNDELTEAELEALSVDAIILSPGPGHPGRAGDFGICGHAIRLGVPLLGVCLGHQGIATFHGGGVRRGDEPVHGRISLIRHNGDRLFQGIPAEFNVVRYHSLVIDGGLPECLEATAFAADGVVMAVRHRTLPQWGVQFHPESICTEYGDQIIANFLEMAGGTLRETPSCASTSNPIPAPLAPPVSSRRLALDLDPERAFVTLFGNAPYAFWLDGEDTAGPNSRFSFMGAVTGPEDRIIRYSVARGEVSITRDGGTERVGTELWGWLHEEVKHHSRRDAGLPFSFNGGLVGYLGYEMKAECGGSTEYESEHPDAVMLACQRYLAFDHAERAVYMVAQDGESVGATRWFDETEATLRALAVAPDPVPEPVPVPAAANPTANTSPPPCFHLHRDRAEYISDVESCLEEIARGESYEVCLTTQIEGPPLPDPLAAYCVLRRRNPAPYASFLRFDDLAVLSCSPELFLRIDAHGHVVSKPIKGTRKRSEDPDADDAERIALEHSEKDRAENLMIVDLLRNDLGRVCEIGSVEVPHLMEVESYTGVHHLVSTVTGTLTRDRNAVDCLRAAFPGGSMTGAPKLRTMEIIDRLERGARGIYSGCIGYLSFNGAAEFSITIRTAVSTPTATTIGVGGAVVALSEPEVEFEEILTKGRPLLEGMAAYLTASPNPTYHLAEDQSRKTHE